MRARTTGSHVRPVRRGVQVVVLAVIASLLALGGSSVAVASSNGLGPKDCQNNGWKTLATPAGKPMQNVLICSIYAGLGGQLRRTQTITFTSVVPSPAPVGSTYHPTATASSGLPVTITRDASSAGCTLTAGVVTFTGVGACVLNADQAGNGVYLAAPRVKQTVSVSKSAQTVTFTSSPPSPALVGATYTPSATASSGLAVTITRAASSTGCTLTSGVVTLTAAGTCVLNADQAGNANFVAATRVTQTFQVTKSAQTVSFSTSPPASALVGATYTPSASATSGLAVAITLASTSTGCSLAGGVVSLTGVGTCVLNADQSGNASYSAAARVQQTFQVFKKAQTVSFTSSAPAPAHVGDTYNPAASATSGLGATITVDATSTGCSLASGVVSFTGAGTCVLDADQSGDTGNDAAAQVQQTIQVVKKTQTVSFGTAAPSPGVVSGTYTPTASATSGLTAAITVDASSTGCSLASGVVTFTGAGSCVLDADQSGNAAYDAAAGVQQTIQVVKQTQSVSFSTTAPSAPALAATYTPTATATSGLTVAITLDATSTGCTLASGVVTFTASGTCALDANQAGNGAYLAATQVQQLIAIVGGPTPVAVADSATVNRRSSTNTISVLANDTSVDATTKITAVTQPANGSVGLAADQKTLTYTPTGEYCNSDVSADGDADTFTYTLNGGSSATVSVKVVAVAPADDAAAPTFIPRKSVTRQRGAGTPVDITAPLDGISNTLTDNAKITLNAGGVFADPESCFKDGATLTFHWTVVYEQLLAPPSVFTDAGITGATTPTLTALPNALLGISDTPGAGFLLDVTSTITHKVFHLEIRALVGSSLNTTIYHQCQALPYGDPGCQIKAAGPVTEGLPTAVADSTTVNRQSSANMIDVMANDTDPDGKDNTITAVTQPTNGTVAIAADKKTVTYTPGGTYCNSDPSADGAPDSFTYTLNGGSTATVSVKVVAVDLGTGSSTPELVPGKSATRQRANNAPVPIVNPLDSVANTLANNAKIILDASAAFVDPAGCFNNGATLDYHWNIYYEQALAPPSLFSDAGVSGYSTPTLTATANSLISISDTPGAGFILTATSKITGKSRPLEIRALVGSALDASIYNQCQALPYGDPACQIKAAGPVTEGLPTAVADSATVNRQSSANTIDVMANDTDPDGKDNTVTAVTQPTNGTVAIAADKKTVTYTPGATYCNSDPSADGAPDSFTYTLNGGSSATVSVKVVAVDLGTSSPTPEFVPGKSVTRQRGSVIVPIVNPLDSIGNTLANNAKIILDASAAFVDPAGCFNNGATLDYHWNVYFEQLLAPPSLFADAGISGTGTPILTAAANSLLGISDTPGAGFIVTATSKITGKSRPLEIRALVGSTLDVPTWQQCQSVPPGDASCTNANAGPSPDNPPTAVNDSATVNRRSSANTIDVMANDTDFGGGDNTITGITQPTNGTVAIAADKKTVTYTPGGTYCNSDPSADATPDSFTYTLNGGSSAMVSVKVVAVDLGSTTPQPAFVPGKSITQQRGAGTPVAIANPLDSGGNTLNNNVKITLNASAAFVDPGGCFNNGATLDYHWNIYYEQLLAPPSSFSDIGVSGYRTPILTATANALLGTSDPPGGGFFLTVTSKVTGKSVVVEIRALVGSSLDPAIYAQCQSVPVGDPSCQITAAGPADPSTT